MMRAEHAAKSGGSADAAQAGGRRPLFEIGCAVFLALVHLALVLHGASRHSAVYDEVVHPASGYAILTTGDHRINPEHPPLMKMITGAMWLGTGLDAAATPGWRDADQWQFGAFGQNMLYESGRSPAQLLFRARLPVALLSVALALVVFGCALRWFGAGAALGAIFLYVFDPLVIAHAGFATLDLGGAAFFFFAAAAFPAALIAGGWLRIVGAGVLLGCALTAKQISLPLLVVLPVLAWAATRWSGTPRRAAALRVLAVFGAAFLTASVICGPSGVGALVKAFEMQKRHAEAGHPAYAFGLYRLGGWWWYFPAAWAVKTPIAMLATTIPGIAALVALARRRVVVGLALLLPPALLAAASLATPLNLGVRYWLPLTPFLALGGGAVLDWLWRRGRATRALAVVAVALMCAGTWSVHPDELAYSNEFAGDADNTWRLLTDSNVDWGQDLPALAAEVGKKPLRRLYLAYFGTADPRGHGITNYCWLPSYGLAPREFKDGPAPDGREWVAVSATLLTDIFTPRHDAYAWLAKRPMTAFPGHSIALYDITGDADAHRRLGEKALEFQFPEAAETALRRAVEIAPSDVRARLDLAGALATQERWREAAAECERAEQLRPGSSDRPPCAQARQQSPAPL